MPTQISGTNGVDKIQNNTVSTSSIQALAVSGDKLNGGQSGSAPIYAARAWVNFNGTGTVAIRASGNVSSITDNGIGDYTVNFTTAMPDANYSVVAMCGADLIGNPFMSGKLGQVPTTTQIRLNACNGINGQTTDPERTYVTIFR
jgi:hypothetical protein